MNASKRAKKLPRFVRIVRARPQLFLCAVLAMVISEALNRGRVSRSMTVNRSSTA